MTDAHAHIFEGELRRNFMLIRRKLIAIFLAIILTTLGSFPQAFANNRHRGLKVMTYNMYLGTDFTGVFTAQTPEVLVAEVAEAFTDVIGGNVPERTTEIADQIAASSPDLVGLQEVALWRTGDFMNPAPATDVAVDHLQLLMDALALRGLNYAPIVIQSNLDAELPGVFSPTAALDIRFTDRVVILARTDLKQSEFSLENTQAGNYTINMTIPVLGQPITVTRGWTLADVKYRGKTYRFVNTHLESFHPLVNLAQTQELLQVPTNTELPVILVGDFNSDAATNGPAYLMITGGGFADIWSSEPPTNPGLTWPLSGEIPNTIMPPTERLDLIFTRGTITLTDADIVGEDPILDLTPSGFRPSDHAGVIGTVILQP